MKTTDKQNHTKNEPLTKMFEYKQRKPNHYKPPQKKKKNIKPRKRASDSELWALPGRLGPSWQFHIFPRWSGGILRNNGVLVDFASVLFK